MTVFNQNDPLKRRKKPVQPTGSVLSGLNGPGLPAGGIQNQVQQPQPQQQASPSVFGAPAPVQGAQQPASPLQTRQQQPVVPPPQRPPDTPLDGTPIGGTPVGGTTTGGPTPIEVTPQDANILSSLNPDFAKLVEEAIQNQLSGTAMGAQFAANNEAFARASQQARTAGGAAAAGQLGQGSANQVQQQTEQAILSAVGQKGLQEAVAMQNMISNGIGQAVDLAKLNTAQSNFLMNLDKDIQALNQSDNQFFANLASNKDLLGMKLSSEKVLNQMQIDATAKLAEDANFLTQQGIDLESAKLYGYEDANGNWVMGSLQIQGIAFQNALNSQAGQSFANYITANPNTDINDPAVQKQGQALWESLGNEGPVDQAWLEARIEAVKDPSLTNPIIGTKAMLDDAVASGAISQENADIFWKNFIDTLSGVSGDDVDPDIDPVDQTTKQLFADWAENNLPVDFKDSVTQQDWVDAGKPETWEEFLKATQIGPDNTTGPDTTTPTKPIWDTKNGAIAMTDEDIGKIIEKINQGFGPVINKYAMDTTVPGAGKSLSTGLVTPGVDMRADVNANLGRIVKLKDGRSVVLVGHDISSRPGIRPPKFLKFVVYDPKTGNEETIQVSTGQ